MSRKRKTQKPAWSDLTWIKVGDTVAHIDSFGRTPGQRTLGLQREDGSTAWLLAGAFGVVVELHAGYPAHDCPNHGDDDCYCGDGSGRMDAQEAWAVVEYQAEDLREPGVRRAIMRDEEGQRWRRITNRRAAVLAEGGAK